MKTRDVEVIGLSHPQDVVLARQRARLIAQQLGFREIEQARIATAVSEIARNAFRYAAGGQVSIGVDGSPPAQNLIIEVNDKGPGIPHLQEVFDGDYVSQTGMGQGIVGARRLMDDFEIQTGDAGTHVVMRAPIPSVLPINFDDLRSQMNRAARNEDEFYHQSIELRHTLEELTERNEELGRLSRELEDTNRGVVALYAELEDRAEQLRRVNQIQTQFMSYMSHEFRTPLDSMIALSGLLLAHADGPLTAEQEKQVELLRRSARDLLSIVDDLLDSARVEAGKLQVRPTSFLVSDLFSALRATLRPLLMTDDTELEFYAARDLPMLYTDEVRLSQILRNLISNALKFTEAGKVVVRARMVDSKHIEFSVADTGVGIDEAGLSSIFRDFEQVESPLQRRRKGTGLGLPLARKLAELLGGTLRAESKVGTGSTFMVRIPVAYEI